MAMHAFHPASKEWFESRFGQPTAAQEEAWPAIKSGEHVLISAPTGGGKTLAAFYAVIDNLLQETGLESLRPGVRIVYVSPLKALGNDIGRNLEEPLAGIAQCLHQRGEAPVDISIAVRSGDTPPSERQKMAKNPPHILVTTPESLYLLLTSASGRAMLATTNTVITDEIHAMLGDKRGSHLALSIERLQHLVSVNGGRRLQRIGLSATQKPIEMVAEFLVGKHADSGEASGPAQDGSRPEHCVIVDSGHRRELDVRLEVPQSPLSALMSNEVWEELYQRLVALVEQHETTLVFVNTRRLSERLALALAERLGADSVCSHHGSMSKELRHDAEQKLKAGKLKVLVATASMELGIDIGSVDLVVQFASPKSIATFLQRVGRSGHSIHGTPKGILFPLTRDDLVECSALLHSIKLGQLDKIVMPQKPMDILAQQIVAEVSSQGLGKSADDTSIPAWDVSALFKLFSRAYPYRDLTQQEFTDIVAMLAEGYSTRRGRRGSYLHLDAINQQVRSRRGANLVALTNGGAIPDMFDYQVVLDPEDIVVGSLNEDFALEALPGDVFTLGTHSWQMLRVDGLKVRVRDAQGMQPSIPFWFGEGPGRTTELSEAVSALRQRVNDLILDESPAAAAQWLEDNAAVPNAGAVQLVAYLHAGMKALGSMPTRDNLVMERFFDEVGDMHVVIHSPYGSRINRGWGLALRKKFCRTFNFELQAAANEDSIVISLGSVHSFPLDEVFRYLQTSTLRETLVQALLDAPMFEVRWRWNATRSLAIQRNRSGKRVPPQFQRMDAEDLIAQVFPDQIACQENLTGKRDVPQHPLVDQTIDDCLTEAMDIGELTQLIAQVENSELNLVAKDLREPSPFAQEIINARPYAFLDDAPFEERRTNAIRNRSWADPAETGNYSELEKEAIQRVRDEAWPLVTNAEELHDALLSLAYITHSEFTENGFTRKAELLQEMGRLCQLGPEAANLWVAAERIPQFRALFGDRCCAMPIPDFLEREEWTEEDALREIVRARLEGLGPVTSDFLAGEMGIEARRVDAALIALEVEGFVFQGNFSGDASVVEWCERRLLQRIHRYTIDTHRKRIKPVSLQVYTQFLFDLHSMRGITETEASPSTADLDGQTRLQASTQMLDGLSAPAAAWESDLYPQRVNGYDPAWLDQLCISGRLVWGRYTLSSTHSGKRRGGPIKASPITIANRSNLDIWQALARGQVASEHSKTGDDEVQDMAPMNSSARKILEDLERHGASFYDEIQARTGLLSAQLEEGLGELVSSGRITSDSFTGLRALLSPGDRKSAGYRRRGNKAMFGVADAGRWSLLKPIQWEQDEGSSRPSRRWEVLDEEQLERLVAIYLQRWGVLFRSLLERESSAPPWRILLSTLRRLELRGTLRGGRFVAGVGGEQFAYSETVDALRKQEVRAELICLSAVDPLNLLSIVEARQKVPRHYTNRILYREAVPIAVLEAGKCRFLREVDADKQWEYQQFLLRREYPPRLRSYLGKRR